MKHFSNPRLNTDDDDEGMQCWPDSGMDATDAITDRGNPYDDDQYDDQKEYDEDMSQLDVVPTMDEAIRRHAPTSLKHKTINVDVNNLYDEVLSRHAIGTFDVLGKISVTNLNNTAVKEVDFFVSNFPVKISEDEYQSGYPDHNSLITFATGPDGKSITNQSDTVAYAIQPDGYMGEIYCNVGVVIFPTSRAQVEVIHRSAALAMAEGKDWPEISRVIQKSANSIGVTSEAFKEHY